MLTAKNPGNRAKTVTMLADDVYGAFLPGKK
jgi:hypothetical protein